MYVGEEEFGEPDICAGKMRSAGGSDNVPPGTLLYLYNAANERIVPTRGTVIRSVVVVLHRRRRRRPLKELWNRSCDPVRTLAGVTTTREAPPLAFHLCAAKGGRGREGSMRSSSVFDYDDTIATATVNVCVSAARLIPFCRRGDARRFRVESWKLPLSVITIAGARARVRFTSRGIRVHYGARAPSHVKLIMIPRRAG